MLKSVPTAALLDGSSSVQRGSKGAAPKGFIAFGSALSPLSTPVGSL